MIGKSKIDGGYIYDKIRSYENCLIAVDNACKDHKHNPKVIQIKNEREKYATLVKEILDNETFEYGEFHHDMRWERGKLRDIWYVDTFPDRIIQHACFNVILPILHGCVISQSYAGVKNRGVHKGLQKMEEDMHNYNATRYCYKADIKSYFKSIDRNILYKMLCEKITCKRTRKLLYIFIFKQPDSGLLIGLYSSQILGVFYLYKFGHYCKEELRIKYIYIYMDDIVILSNSKNKLHAYHTYIEKYLNDNLNLKLKDNYAFFPVEKRRIDFMGYVKNHNSRMIRKRTKINYNKSVNTFIRCLHNKQQITPHIIKSIASYEGNILKWCTDDSLVVKNQNRIELEMTYYIFDYYE